MGSSSGRLRGPDIGEAEWDWMWHFYQDTGSRKWGRPYLTRQFFDLIGESMDDRLLLFLALRDGQPIAGALNLIGPDTLYGRYWGALEELPFLHFELCFYQAIEWAIANGLGFVQAGAQGEHKLARGYEPVMTRSAHFIVDPGFRAAVERFLDEERQAVAADMRMDAGAVALSHVLIAVDRDAARLGVGNAAVHRARREAPGGFAEWRYGDQPTGAAKLLDVLQRAVEGRLKRLPAKPDALGELVPGDGANEIFSRPSRRDGCRAVIGIGAGTDQRRIPDPAPLLGGQSAGRGRCRDMAVPVDRDRAYRSVLYVRVEAALRQQFVELAAALAGHEPAILDLLQAGLARQAIGAIIRKEDVRPALHQRARKADRRAGGPDARDRAGTPRWRRP